MDYSRPGRAHALAGEYVLGTMNPQARRRFEALLPSHPALQQAVLDWQASLLPLAQSIPPEAPSPKVWEGIERTLFNQTTETKATMSPVVFTQPKETVQRGFWHWERGLSLAMALTLSVVTWHAYLRPTPAPVAQIARAPINVVIKTAAQTDKPQVLFSLSISPDGRALILTPIDPQAPGSKQALELWAVPKEGAPRSLGLVSATSSTTVLRDAILEGVAAFAVSIEPESGSPTGAPTGPVVGVGKLEI